MKRCIREYLWPAVLLALLLSPFGALGRSLGVMSIASALQWRQSLPSRQGVQLHIPGGLATPQRDWYPLTLCYDATAPFRQYTGNEALSLTILYNFAAFDPLTGCSALYDPASPRYSSFYGAYLIEDATGAPYGFSQDGQTLRPEAIALLPRFDWQELVLADFGLTAAQSFFDWQITGQTPGVSYAGQEGWVRLDATLTANGAAHGDTGFVRSYLQYGRPHQTPAVCLAPVPLQGRLYARHFPEENLSVFFYLLCADAKALEDCDRRILSHSTLSFSADASTAARTPPRPPTPDPQ